MTIARANFPDLLDPAFRKIYTDAEKELPYMYTQIFNVVNSTKNLEKDSSVSGLGTLIEKPEGAAITYEDILQGYDVTYTHKTFGLGTIITKEMMDDDQFNVIRRRASNLAISVNRSIELTAADVLNGGFTAGGAGKAKFITGYDTKALFATDHPRSDGGTAISNTTTADLAEDSLETALIAMRSTKDDKGQMMLVRPDTLVVPPALEKEARILLETTGRVGSAINDINVFKGRLDLKVWDYLGTGNANGSDTQWFILDSKSHKLMWFWRQRPNLENETDFDTKNIKYSVDARWSCGFSDWRGIYGSKGDNS